MCNKHKGNINRIIKFSTSVTIVEFFAKYIFGQNFWFASEMLKAIALDMVSSFLTFKAKKQWGLFANSPYVVNQKFSELEIENLIITAVMACSLFISYMNGLTSQHNIKHSRNGSCGFLIHC